MTTMSDTNGGEWWYADTHEDLEERRAQELTVAYMDSLVRIQGLTESREARKQ
jgi:hypothetical protein